jgi:hypothetical protein
MFANSGGGVLLIGVTEKRDAQGQPTGFPDPDAPLGIEVPNPEQVLQALDARVVACIEDRLPLESTPIPVAGGLCILAIRVLNSLTKPHRVDYQGRTYFPSRRERQRYEMDVREIKELVMRTASRLEEAEGKLKDSFRKAFRKDDLPYLLIGIMPVFGRDFIVDLRQRNVINAIGRFDLWEDGNFINPTYHFHGLARSIGGFGDSSLELRRNGMMLLNYVLPTKSERNGQLLLFVSAIDRILRQFVIRAAAVYDSAGLAGPYLVATMLRTTEGLIPGFPIGIPGGYRAGMPIKQDDYLFPTMQADGLADVDKIIRPLCDQAHQTFAAASSPCFDGQGVWIEPR